MQTGRNISNNKLDIVIQDSEKGPCVLIYVAISGHRNVIKNEAEKTLKYKDLIVDFQRKRNVKTKVTPVIEGVAGTISKSFRHYLNTIPGKH
jgi:hypothetical protein